MVPFDRPMISTCDQSLVSIVLIIPSYLLRHRIQLLSILTVYCLVSDVDSSVGDSLVFYQKCLYDCQHVNCSTAPKAAAFRNQQKLFDWLAGWTCPEDCRHECQWKTIDYLSLDEVAGSPFHRHVPQFYGKWTFPRVLGAQEPVSALFSIFNLLATLIAWRKFCRSVRCAVGEEEIRTDPLFLITNISAVLAINAWFWSTVFHVHDYPVTEKLDYFSASSVVLFNLYSILIRLVEDFVLRRDPSPSISSSMQPASAFSWAFASTSLSVAHLKNRNFLFIAIGMGFIAFYWYHVSYMAFMYFDYGYNMKVNISMGLAGSGLWFLWAFMRIQRQDEDACSVEHVKTGIFTVIFLNLCLVLEIADFPPILCSSLDSHALWHLATTPIPFFWFRFLAQETIHSRGKKAVQGKR